jgi:type VI secretion system protein ImpD
VAYLIKQFDPSEEEIRLRIIHWQWAELSADLENALEFDQSQLFKKIYAEHLDTPGGKPFGVLIGDYYVQHRRNRANPDDITTLGKLSEVASAALCPFITSCRPSMFGLNSFAELEMPSELSSAFNPQSDSDNRRWLEFRNSDEARFIGIVLPHILMRLPYGYDNPDLHHPCYYERVENPDHAGREASGIRNYLWGNAAYAFGAVLIRAFLNYGWFADIRGLRVDENDGGIINDLPVPWFETDPKQVVYKYSTEVAITERRAAELTDLGFISLVRVKDTRYSWFFSCPSVQLPQTYEFSEDLVSINARMSAMLNYILCVSRFGHYIKQIIRDRRVGALTNTGEIKKYISDEFLFKYRESNESASSERKAAAPLKDYEVEVQQMPGRPGNYACTIYLQPHYQFDYVDAKIRLLTEFAPAEP